MDNISQHFRKEEQVFAEKCLDQVRNVEQRFVPALTSFLNPRERFILKSVAGSQTDIQLAFCGGYEGAERQRALIFPSYFIPEETDFEIILYEVDYPIKFHSLTHGHILGTLLGNGLSREVIGDILTDGTRWQFYIEKQLASYLPVQIEKMGKSPVKLRELPFIDQIQPIDEWQEEQKIVSSLRLDTVLSSVYPMSRQKAKEWIETGNVKINWTDETNPSVSLVENDVVSVRQKGRFQLMEQSGITKKEKKILIVRVLKTKKS